ncbi:MAG: response regulator [Burkholderiaceae bacterium]|nr:response regulator [Rhodoferax sp.]MCP5285190.1 response regulator [Burkholderiaceae bacterium]
MSKSVLVVDDSSSVRTVVGIALRRSGYEVIEAHDGHSALAKLDGRPIHLVISDVNMPGMDGLTLLREIKKHPKYRCTPVMMLTTESAAEKKDIGRQEGARAWMTKPFQAEQMVHAVQRLVMA